MGAASGSSSVGSQPAQDGPSPVVLLDDAVLRPLVERAIAMVLDRLAEEQQSVGDKLAYSEADAAALLGVRRHVLRDARLRGEIAGCRVGKSIRYERQELIEYLRRRRGL
jgi:hypothetical protein